MDLHLSRLRTGEWLGGVSALVLLASLFLLNWYGSPAASTRTSQTGWHTVSHLRWMILASVLAAVALMWFQASRPAPAIPVVLSVIVSVLGTLTVLWLIYRVILSTPGTDLVGAYIGLAAGAGIAVGGYLSMRREGIAVRDQPAEIETVALREFGRGDRS